MTIKSQIILAILLLGLFAVGGYNYVANQNLKVELSAIKNITISGAAIKTEDDYNKFCSLPLTCINIAMQNQQQATSTQK